LVLRAPDFAADYQTRRYMDPAGLLPCNILVFEPHTLHSIPRTWVAEALFR